jgi:tetraacyldisaccharide 4'-kinase
MQHRTDPALSRLSRPLLGLLSLPYKAIAFCQWRLRSLRQRAFPGMFIISVDSLSFGGAGKTPLVMAIGKALEARGARFAVISRGYRSRFEKKGVRVGSGHSCRDVGDEALMLKARFPGQEIFIGRDRLRSIAAAAASGVRILILDDGFQSSHIRKDFSIMLVNPGHPYYYLRHFLFLARRDDRVLAFQPAPRAQGDGPGYDFAITGFRDIHDRPVEIGTDPLVAFSALGDNARFAGDMGRYKLAAFRGFADHHAFTPEDLRAMEALRKETGAAWLVCTEKDLCKMKHFLAPGPLAGDLQGIPLLYARNEIQLPGDVIAGIIEHAAKKGLL